MFEYLYFMRASTVFNSRAVADVRARVGQELANEAPCPADVVVGVPESGIAAAEGYAMTLNRPIRVGLMRSPYIGRTFIEPSQKIRNLGVRLKLSINRMVVDGRRVVLVDDSIVRSTTMTKLVSLVREAGATEVHVRIASPMIRFPASTASTPRSAKNWSPPTTASRRSTPRSAPTASPSSRLMASPRR